MNTVMVRCRALRKSRTRGTTTSRYDGRRSHPGSPCVLRYDHLLSRSSDKLAMGFVVVMSSPAPHHARATSSSSLLATDAARTDDSRRAAAFSASWMVSLTLRVPLTMWAEFTMCRPGMDVVIGG